MVSVIVVCKVCGMHASKNPMKLTIDLPLDELED